MQERALIKKEKDTLEKLENIIKENIQAFYKVGSALLQIRESRLYRDTHNTFEDYCKDRWDMGRNYVNKLIESANVVKNLGTMVPKLPLIERQARPLIKLEPELQREAWAKVIKTAPECKITAKHVTQIVKEIRGEKIKAKTKKGREIINKTELITEDFKKAFDDFYRQIQLARIEGWKHTSKESAKLEAKDTKEGREVKGGFIFHDLRHTFVTDMRKAGIQKSVRAAITGHALTDMDDRYNVVDEKDKLESIERLEAYRDSEVVTK